MVRSMPSIGSVARRAARPKTRRREHPISTVDAIAAATSGGSTGTLYSSRNSASVVSQLATFMRPALRKTPAIAKRKRSWWIDNGNRPSRWLIAAIWATRPAAGRVGTAVWDIALLIIVGAPFACSLDGRRPGPTGRGASPRRLANEPGG